MPRSLVLVALLLAALGGAAVAVSAAEPEAPRTVKAIEDGTRFVLEDGRTVRLAGLRVPTAPAHAAAARAALEELAVGRRVDLRTFGIDRYGALVAEARRVDGLWLQGALLEAGAAMLQTRPGETASSAEMRALERAARAARRGLWADPALRPKRPQATHELIGSFQIVRGEVLAVETTRRHVYLNFGPDWRTDFTLRLPPDLLEAPGRLAGREIEARGLLVAAGGPLIDISHAEQLEVLP